MDIREYTYILAIVNYGSISRAAKALFISQPSLSIYIKNLERRLNITFFEDRKLTLTPEGKVYIDYAQKIVQLNNDLHQELASIAQFKSGIVRIGLTVTKGAFLLPKLLPLLLKEHPEIEIKFVEAISKELEKMVYDGELDFIMVNYPFKEHDLDYTKIYDEEIVVTISRQNPILSKAVCREGTQHMWIDIHDLKEEAFILLKQGQKMRQIADTLFQEAGYQPKIVFETSSAHSAYNLSCTGIGIAFAIDTYCEQSNIETSPLLLSVGNPQLNREFVIAYSSHHHISPAARTVINTIRRYLQ